MNGKINVVGDRIEMDISVWRAILHMKGVKSKKYRIQKKVVKKAISEAILNYAESKEK